ncbi:MAG: hypothetical protein MJ224_03980 [archaeon]|nr:hypothetical protein [archaeon]
MKSDLLFGILILVVIIGVIANITDYTNEKIVDKTALDNLEKITIETSDYLIKNPGTPEDWEKKSELDKGKVDNNIIPGLAIRNKNVKNSQFEDESESNEKVVPNTISYEKLAKVNSYYNQLIDRNLFNNSIKSSIAIYPIDSDVEPIICGDNLDDSDENIISVERYVKCDFFKKFVIYDFNDLKLNGRDYNREVYCNHDNVKELANHANNQKSIWLCKNFRIYKSSLVNYHYYLISSDDIRNFNCYWTLESLNNPSNKTEKLNTEIIDLNPFFQEDLQSQYDNIYSIHFKIPKTKVNEFNCCLVAIPNNMTESGLIDDNKLKYDYFQIQDVKFQMRTAYK